MDITKIQRLLKYAHSSVNKKTSKNINPITITYDTVNNKVTRIKMNSVDIEGEHIEAFAYAHLDYITSKDYE